MEIKPSFWRRVNPLAYTFVLALVTDVVSYHVWLNTQLVGFIAVVTFLLSTGTIFALKKVLERLGKKGPGKKFVAEVVVLHWGGKTTRFWGVYRYAWVAGFAAQYMAYVLDHLGNVHWEFGISFRVHDAEKRAAEDANSAPDGQDPQPA